MNAATELHPNAVVEGPVVRRITWRDHVWLTLRSQERAIVAVVVIAAGLVALLVYAEREFVGPVRCDDDRNCFVYFGDEAILLADVLLRGVSFLPLVIALFWGVPVVARELETRTSVVAWTQDLTRVQWLLGRVATLAVLTVLVSGVVSYFAMRVSARLHRPFVESPDPAWVPQYVGGFGSQFDTRPFELLAPLTVVYSLTGLALGIAVGALVRQVLPSVAIVTVLLVSVRLAVAEWWRPYFQEPIRELHPPRTLSLVPPDSLTIVGFGWVDAAGQRMEDVVLQCGSRFDTDSDPMAACAESRGMQQLLVYQPLERLELFRWIEAGVFAAIGAASLALAVALVRGRHRRARPLPPGAPASLT